MSSTNGENRLRLAVAAWAIATLAPSAARAEDAFAAAFADGLEVTLSLGVESVSTFRGIRARRLNPSVFAALDIEQGPFFVGALASPIGFENETVPLAYGYGGYAPTLFDFDFTVGAGYYAFPGSTDFEIDLDADGIADHSGKKGVLEAFAGVARDFGVAETEFLAFLTPDAFGQTGGSAYYAASLEAPLPFGFALKGHFGATENENDLFNDDYVDYSAALKRSVLGFDLEVKYNNVANLANADEEVVVFSVVREFGLVTGDRRRERGLRKLRNSWAVDKARLGIGR